MKRHNYRFTEQTSDPNTREATGRRHGHDAFNDDPTVPRVVTLKPAYKGYFERYCRFPDGSATIAIVRADGSEVVDTPGKPATPDAQPGVDEALRRFAEAHAGRLLHDGGWWAFDGAIWQRQRQGSNGVTRQVRDALRQTGVADPWPGLVAAVEGLARQEPLLSIGPALVSAGEWDPDPWLLGTPGGTVDLATGILRPADPADRITRATAVAPVEVSDCPLWRRFLHETTGGDVALQTFLQRFCGYALTGETCEHALLFGLGEGGNGKSVFTNIAREIFGSYAAVAAPDLLTQGSERRRQQAHSAEIATLAGARLVTASETEEGRTWAEGRLKLLTGGDPVTARFLGRDPFTFTPRFKLLVTGNHMPLLRTVDAALRRRLCIATVTETYLAGQDLVGQFLAERCDRTPTCLETAGDLYTAWCAFAHAIGEVPGTQRRLATRLARHGLTRDHVHHARVYRGVRLIREGELMAEVREARVGG